MGCKSCASGIDGRLGYGFSPIWNPAREIARRLSSEVLAFELQECIVRTFPPERADLPVQLDHISYNQVQIRSSIRALLRWTSTGEPPKADYVGRAGNGRKPAPPPKRFLRPDESH